MAAKTMASARGGGELRPLSTCDVIGERHRDNSATCELFPAMASWKSSEGVGLSNARGLHWQSGTPGMLRLSLFVAVREQIAVIAVLQSSAPEVRSPRLHRSFKPS